MTAIAAKVQSLQKMNFIVKQKQPYHFQLQFQKLSEIIQFSNQCNHVAPSCNH